MILQYWPVNLLRPDPLNVKQFLTYLIHLLILVHAHFMWNFIALVSVVWKLEAFSQMEKLGRSPVIFIEMFN